MSNKDKRQERGQVKAVADNLHPDLRPVAAAIDAQAKTGLERSDIGGTHIGERIEASHKDGYAGSVTAPDPERPPANIPKALHHLRRAANTLGPHDLIGKTIADHFAGVTEWHHLATTSVAMLSDIASALDLDHNAAEAAANVRAAIEALS